MNSFNSNGGNVVAFFLLNLDGGGAERSVATLAGDIARQRYSVDLVVGDADSDYRLEVSSAVNVVDLRTRSPFQAFFRLISYLRRRNPRAVMSALDVSNIMLVIAARFSGYKGRVVVGQRAVVDASLDELTPSRRVLVAFLQRLIFPRADALISNSNAAAGDLRALSGIRAEKVVVIHNAVDAERINVLAREPVMDHFFLKNKAPLIVSVGSLTKRKDMGSLIRAIEIVKRRRPIRLAVVGKGVEQQTIENLISVLGLREDVYLPGFDANPYKWMAGSAVFVSSSTGEGFPNVIAEALALGRPIVATDCPGDTAELLGHGKWGRLVPVGEPERMADAILDTLDDPNPPDGRIRAADFSPMEVTSAYLDVLLPKFDRAASSLRQII